MDMEPAHVISDGEKFFQDELALFEESWELGNFTAQLPGNTKDWHECTVHVTPFSLFVIFQNVAVRFDDPFDFKMVRARKNQQSHDGDKVRHKLTATLNGKKFSAMFLRDAESASTYKYASRAIEDEEDWRSISKDFEVAFFEMQCVFDQLLFGFKQNNKPTGAVPLSMQMFVDALYTSLIRYHHKVLIRFRESGDYHESPEDIHYSQGVILRMLLEYGKKANKYGCFGEGRNVYPDIISGNTSRPGLSLNSIHAIISDHDAELADRYVETLKVLLGVYLYHTHGNKDFEESSAWMDVDWD